MLANQEKIREKREKEIDDFKEISDIMKHAHNSIIYCLFSSRTKSVHTDPCDNYVELIIFIPQNSSRLHMESELQEFCPNQWTFGRGRHQESEMNWNSQSAFIAHPKKFWALKDKIFSWTLKGHTLMIIQIRIHTFETAMQHVMKNFKIWRKQSKCKRILQTWRSFKNAEEKKGLSKCISHKLPFLTPNISRLAS